MSGSEPRAQMEMFPDRLPDVVVRIWKAIGRWYATGTHKPPTRTELLEYFEPTERIGKRTLDRAYHTHRDLLPWPVHRGQQPPWLTQPDVLTALKPADQPTNDGYPSLPPEALFMLVDPPPGGRIRAVNAAACRVSGYSEAELLGAMYEPMLRHGEPSALTWKPDLHQIADEVRARAPHAAREWDTYWITKARQRIDLVIRMTWDASTGCYALHLRVVPPHIQALRFGPGALVAASFVAMACAHEHRAVLHGLHHVLASLRPPVLG